MIYRFSVGLFYANAERFSKRDSAPSSGPQPPRWFVLDAVAIDDVDYTAGQTLSEIADQLAERKIVLAIAEASREIYASSSIASESRTASAPITTTTGSRPHARRSARCNRHSRA